MEMEMLMISGFVYNFIGDIDMARHYYTKGYEQANNLGKEYYKAVCLSNLGVIDSNKELDDLFNSLESNFEQEEQEDMVEEDQNEDYDYEVDDEVENKENN